MHCSQLSSYWMYCTINSSLFLRVYSTSIQPSPTLNLVRDYLCFIIAFFEIIDTSAPHIYHSALPPSPKTSVVRQLYKQYAHPLARVVQGLPVSWEPAIATVYHGG